VCATLGSHLLERLIEAKRIEWQEYNRQVSAWELERYLSVY
jgi:glutamine synthetase